MEAIILAGGFGTRLRPLTFTRAKSLLPILNQSMISYLMQSLPSEVTKVILAVNYRKHQIETFFKNNDYNKEIVINDEPEPLGTGGAVKFAEDHITGPFLVLNSDIITSLDIEKLVNFHHQQQAVATISLWPVEKVSEFGVVDIKKNGNIVRFVEKPKPQDAPSNLINAGAYYLQPEILDYIETGRLVSMEKEIFPQIINDTGCFYGFTISGYWIDVGRIQSYIDVHKLLLKQQHQTFIQGKNSHIHGNLISSCVGDNVEIAAETEIIDSVVLDNTTIGKKCYLENCVIASNCKIDDATTLKNVVVGDDESISSGTKLHDTIVWNKPVPPGYPKKQIGNVLAK